MSMSVLRCKNWLRVRVGFGPGDRQAFAVLLSEHASRAVPVSGLINIMFELDSGCSRRFTKVTRIGDSHRLGKPRTRLLTQRALALGHGNTWFYHNSVTKRKRRGPIGLQGRVVAGVVGLVDSNPGPLPPPGHGNAYVVHQDKPYCHQQIQCFLCGYNTSNFELL